MVLLPSLGNRSPNRSAANKFNEQWNTRLVGDKDDENSLA